MHVTTLFLTIYAAVNGIAVAHRLRLVGGDPRVPGSGTYVLTTLNGQRSTVFDPFTTEWVTSHSVMAYERKLIDLGLLAKGSVDRITMRTSLPGCRPPKGRTFEELLYQFANLAPTARFPMTVAIKVGHAEAALKQLQLEYGHTS